MKSFASSKGLVGTLALLLALSACAGTKDKDKVPPEESVSTLYDKGASLMQEKEYKKAAAQFGEVERQHPYSPWATRAQLMEAYAQYLNLDYDAAVGTLDEFIQLHPGNKEAAYASYLRALCFYERIGDVRRDSTNAREALKALRDVTSKYPESSYAKDAALKIDLVNDHLAGSEMDIGRWYLGQKLYIAAIGRFRTVVEKYQTTSHVPEALERLVESYVALGIPDEAQKAAAVLGYNYPGSDWYQDAYRLLTENGMAAKKP